MAFYKISNILFFSIIVLLARVNANLVNVMDYGAVGDGIHDDTKAFVKAWNASCKSTTDATLLVPAGITFFVGPITLSGPCKPETINFQVHGTIMAPDTPGGWAGQDPSKWIIFKGLEGITVTGNGIVDGRGKAWWDQSCRYHPTLPGCTTTAPTAMSFITVKNSHLKDVHFVNSPQTHILLFGVSGFNVDHVNVKSPGHSPNTDGIHLQIAQHVTITNSNFMSGDDCISIGDRCSDIIINGIHCGPGHGISVGSLGKSKSRAEVHDIHVENCNFFNTTNGVRIKTYQGGKGYATGFSFKSLNFTDVQYPIIIDQYYCSVAGACKPQSTAVQISNITYERLTGTSDSPVAINLNCSQAVGCTELKFNEITFTSAKPGREVTASCTNAHGITSGDIEPPIACLQK